MKTNEANRTTSSETLSSKFNSLPNFFASNSPYFNTPLIPIKSSDSNQATNQRSNCNQATNNITTTSTNNHELMKLSDLLLNESTLDPFNDCELKTLNDMEELKKILDNNNTASMTQHQNSATQPFFQHLQNDVKFN